MKTELNQDDAIAITRIYKDCLCCGYPFDETERMTIEEVRQSEAYQLDMRDG